MKQNLKAKILAFYEAIKKHGPHTGNLFKRFPAGACGNTSEMLAHYLSEYQEGEFEQIALCYGRTLDEAQSHAWVDVDGWIVDLTCHQFQKGPLKCNLSIPYIGSSHEWFEN